jgi:hypothetical protein
MFDAECETGVPENETAESAEQSPLRFQPIVPHAYIDD